MDKVLRQQLGIRKDREQEYYTTIDYYAYYIQNTERVYHIDRKKYNEVVEDYFKHLANELLTGNEITLFGRMGTVMIIKYKPYKLDKKHLSIDFKSTREEGKTIYYLNDHCGNFRFRTLWSKVKAFFTFQSRYQLKLTRYNKRALAQIIKNREQDFIEL